MSKYKNSNSAIRLPLYISIAISVGIFIGANMAGNPSSVSRDFLKGLTKFKQVLAYIENDYVDRVKTDDLVEHAIQSMLKELDPHTSYIPAKDVQLIQSQLEGKYEGIGIEFNIFKDTIHVISPLSGGPSEKLGIRTGDKIVKVEGENVAGINMTNRKVIEMLRGPGGSTVTVEIKRKGAPDLLEFRIERDVIPQHSVDVFYMVTEEIGYIKIARFANSTHAEFKNALIKLKDQGMEKLMIDLTGNPGGYLNRAIQIADELLAGRQLIVYTDGKEKRYTERHYSGEEGDFEEGTVIILVDEGSASASEIVAGALQDHDRGTIVGRRTFGKGLVQLPLDLNDGSELRLTISRYYTPSGRSIQKTYKRGSLDEYYWEPYSRYQSGELYNSDSIKVIDSLEFQTDNGRIVYGGGGISPDYFVPLDSTQVFGYLNRLFSTNSLQEYTVKYAQENKEILESEGYDEFRANFRISDQMLENLISLAEENELPFNQREFNRSRKLLKQLTKAYIARSIWDNDGFYPIFNEQDEIFQKALQLMKETKDLNSN
ncbi:MAG: S41 family peptidase [Ekhidna sp.]|nr:S41 family peptidase [Ekhidna sp.]